MHPQDANASKTALANAGHRLCSRATAARSFKTASNGFGIPEAAKRLYAERSEAGNAVLNDGGTAPITAEDLQ